MKLSLLPCHHAPREAPKDHKGHWPEGETRTLAQLVRDACPLREGHAPVTMRVRCKGCGLYFAQEVT